MAEKVLEVWTSGGHTEADVDQTSQQGYKINKMCSVEKCCRCLPLDVACLIIGVVSLVSFKFSYKHHLLHHISTVGVTIKCSLKYK